ncbi:MAG: glycerol-3-phosphate dehydrogenase/oxidase [Cyclobacteriaceae bacterium]
MQRKVMIQALEERSSPWDVLIIGGGATGLGAAVDAASRGYSTLLLEQSDFAKATSSRSTKLVHGGVHYLEQGDIRLVFESMRERNFMLHNAPHLVQSKAFVIPAYDWWDSPYYSFGLKLYDLMAGKLGMGASDSLSREATLEALPTLDQKNLRAGLSYYDGQFDDARMAISLAKTSADHGGVVINYMKVTGLIKKGDMLAGVMALDVLHNKHYEIKSRVVINATGVFLEDILKLDNPQTKPVFKTSKGVHLVVDQKFLPGEHALLIPQTDDGKIFFAVPWYNRVILGTTDTQLSENQLEPKPGKDEIENILNLAGQYLNLKPQIADIKSHYAGLRPFLPKEIDATRAKEISRGHKIFISASGLLSVIGGKWTTYRQMGVDIIDKAAQISQLKAVKSRTEQLPIHGFSPWQGDLAMPWYGSDWPQLNALIKARPELGQPINSVFPYLKIAVLWAVKEEMAISLEDVLARRTRMLFLDAKESIRIAPEVASLMASENGKNAKWIKEQISSFCALAEGYCPPD